jgi:uncharacterized membrane protein
MVQATNTVSIDRPIDAVFAFVADGEKCPQWCSGILDIRKVYGEGLGAKYAQGVSGPMGRRVAADYEITVYEPGKRIEFQTVAGPVRPHGRYDFEPVDGATRLTFSLEADVSGLRKLFMGSMVQRTMDGEVAALAKLKHVLEA